MKSCYLRTSGLAASNPEDLSIQHIEIVFLRASPREVQRFLEMVRNNHYLKLRLLKASHEQEIKSTLFCLLILMWSRDRQFKFDLTGNNFGPKNFLKFTNFECLLSKQTFANRKSNDFLY